MTDIRFLRYLTINYDYSKTNKWRRLKGLPEVELGPKDSVSRRNSLDRQHQMWGDDIYGHFPEPMPTLQPLTESRRAGKSASPSQESHPVYEQLMGSPPETREPIRSPSLGN